MKFKYFLRGLGVGIVFGALIVFVAYQTSPNKLLTDDAVRNRAMELGMVERQTELDKVIKADTTEQASQETTSQAPATQEISEQTEAASTQETSEQTKAASTQETSEQTKAASTQEASGGAQTTEAVQTASTREAAATSETTTAAVETVQIKITSGMQSSSIAKVLEEKGVIEDAADFDRYLNKKGYATRLRVGSYEVQKQASYETIAKILTN